MAKKGQPPSQNFTQMLFLFFFGSYKNPLLVYYLGFYALNITPRYSLGRRRGVCFFYTWEKDEVCSAGRPQAASWFGMGGKLWRNALQTPSVQDSLASLRMLPGGTCACAVQAVSTVNPSTDRTQPLSFMSFSSVPFSRSVVSDPVTSWT